MRPRASLVLASFVIAVLVVVAVLPAAATNTVGPSGRGTQLIYFVIGNSQTVLAYNPATGVFSSNITLPAPPYAVWPSGTTGEFFAVDNFIGYVYRVDPVSYSTITSTYTIGSNSYICGAPDGSTIYIVDGLTGYIYAIDSNTLSVTHSNTTGNMGYSMGIAVSPDGQYLAIAYPSTNQTAVYRTSDFAMVSHTALAKTPYNTAWSWDSHSYVTLGANGSLPTTAYVVDKDSGNIELNYTGGVYDYDIAAGPNGHTFGTVSQHNITLMSFDAMWNSSVTTSLSSGGGGHLVALRNGTIVIADTEDTPNRLYFYDPSTNTFGSPINIPGTTSISSVSSMTTGFVPPEKVSGTLQTVSFRVMYGSNSYSGCTAGVYDTQGRLISTFAVSGDGQFAPDLYPDITYTIRITKPSVGLNYSITSQFPARAYMLTLQDKDFTQSAGTGDASVDVNATYSAEYDNDTGIAHITVYYSDATNSTTSVAVDLMRRNPDGSETDIDGDLWMGGSTSTSFEFDEYMPGNNSTLTRNANFVNATTGRYGTLQYTQYYGTPTGPITVPGWSNQLLLYGSIAYLILLAASMVSATAGLGACFECFVGLILCRSGYFLPLGDQTASMALIGFAFLIAIIAFAIEQQRGR